MIKEIEKIRARADAATPGPWNDGWEKRDDHFVFHSDDAMKGVADCYNFADATFIAHARTDIPILLDEIYIARVVCNAAEERENSLIKKLALTEEQVDILKAENTRLSEKLARYSDERDHYRELAHTKELPKQIDESKIGFVKTVTTPPMVPVIFHPELNTKTYTKLSDFVDLIIETNAWPYFNPKTLEDFEKGLNCLKSEFEGSIANKLLYNQIEYKFTQYLKSVGEIDNVVWVHVSGCSNSADIKFINSKTGETIKESDELFMMLGGRIEGRLPTNFWR